MSKFVRHGYKHPCLRFQGPWRRFRRAWMERKPLCAKCGRAGKVLDHIKPLHRIKPWDRITLKELLDVKNVQTLCRPCHDEKTAAENSRRPAPEFCACGHPFRKGRPICGVPECEAHATPE